MVNNVVFLVSCSFLAFILFAFRTFENVNIELGEFFCMGNLKKILLDVFGIRISLMAIDYRRKSKITSFLLLGSFFWLCYESFYQYDTSITEVILRIWVVLGIRVSSYLIKILDDLWLDLFIILYPSIIIGCFFYWEDFKVLAAISLLNYFIDTSNYFLQVYSLQWKKKCIIDTAVSKRTFDIKIPIGEDSHLSEIWKIDMNTHISHLNPVYWDKQRYNFGRNYESKQEYLVLAFETEAEQRSAAKYFACKPQPLGIVDKVPLRENIENILFKKYPRVRDSYLDIISLCSQFNITYNLYVSIRLCILTLTTSCIEKKLILLK